MADRIAIMRRGVVVAEGTLDELRREAETGRRFSVRLSKTPSDPEGLRAWLRERTVSFELSGDAITYSLPWQAAVADLASSAAALQSRLAVGDAPCCGLEARQVTRDAAYTHA